MQMRFAFFALLFAFGGWSATAVPVMAQGDKLGAGPTVPIAKPLRAVIELFTSQACPDCPAADKVLQQFAGQDDVIALSLPVQIWDYHGWKDTLASPRNTDRLRQYSNALQNGKIYTPQVVINGRQHALGSMKDKIETIIEAQNVQGRALSVPVRVGVRGRRFIIQLGQIPKELDVSEATIWLAVIQKKAEVAVQRGANAGKILAYHNVVREMTPIGMWSGQSKVIQIARHALMQFDTQACAVLIQQGTTGPIIGAAWLGL